MVNSEDFVKRLEIMFDYYGLTASSFADKIGVQRSSLSHLLSGRNKPSLDFILKIIEVFPEVDLYWILNGKGSFPKNDLIKNVNTPEGIFTPTPTLFSEVDKNSNTMNLFSAETESVGKNQLYEIPEEKNSSIKNINQDDNQNEMERIVIFYKNGTFKTYSPER